jgi:hypothetical protein
VNATEVATPLALVVAVFTPPANVPLAPVVGTSNVTTAPGTGFWFPSTTVATNGTANVELTVAVCGVPLVAVIEMSAPVMFVRVKLAGVATPATVAVTVKPPVVVFAVNVDEVAMPLAFVVSVSVVVEFELNMPLAPVPGAVNVTDAPVTGFELLSTTFATSGAPNAALISASCRDPLATEIDAAGPDVFVRRKLVVAVTPATEAVTVLAPITPLAVNGDDVTTPLELVVSVSVFVPFENVPLAPVAGAVKVTNAPLTGVPPIVTVATSGLVNVVLSCAL